MAFLREQVQTLGFLQPLDSAYPCYVLRLQRVGNWPNPLPNIQEWPIRKSGHQTSHIQLFPTFIYHFVCDKRFQNSSWQWEIISRSSKKYKKQRKIIWRPTYRVKESSWLLKPLPASTLTPAHFILLWRFLVYTSIGELPALGGRFCVRKYLHAL